MQDVTIPFGKNASIIGKKIDQYVNRFVGIPFALPPVGDFRWQQPRKLPSDFFTKSEKPYDATQFKDLCLQPPSPLPHESGEHAEYSEDCLYVNVWAPSSEPPAGGWPVLIWIHGGWLQLGDPMFDSRMHPWELISKDGYGLECVVVAPGYRLNVFGFLGADVDGLLPGNWGFWDQRCAIEWISDNVKYFGGNNSNVTLGGVSAGAYSVQVQLFYELFQATQERQKPMFQRVWMSSNAMPTAPKTLQEATSQFDDLCKTLDIDLTLPASPKLSRLRAISGPDILSTLRKLKTSTFRAVLDDKFITKDIIKYIYSGELANRFHARNMKLLIGEVEHEEIMYRIGAPSTQAGLLPGLQNYYRSSVAQALVEHYTKSHTDVADMFTGIVTDVQVRATTRAFSKFLVEGGVPSKDVMRYRISLPIKGIDDTFTPEQTAIFSGKVPHAFDFLHWFYIKRVGFTEEEDKVIREWLAPFATFIKGEEVSWGTSDVTQFRHLTEDATIEIVQDPYWGNLMDTAAVLRRVVEQEGGVVQTIKRAVVPGDGVEDTSNVGNSKTKTIP